jgi:diguanylate cyclase (GGDEF)-like protein
VAASLVFCLVALAAALFGRSFGAEFLAWQSAAVGIWSVLDLVTAALLFGRFYTSRRPAFGAIGAAYGLGALLLWAYLAIKVILSAAVQPSLPDLQLAPMLYLLAQVLFSVLLAAAIVYERRGPRELEGGGIARVVYGSVVAVIAVAALTVVVLVLARPFLPILLTAGNVLPPGTAHVWFGVAAINAVAFSMILWLRRENPSGLRVWLAVSTLAAVLNGLLVATATAGRSHAFETGEALLICSALFVTISSIYHLASVYDRVRKQVSTQASRGASRARALWQIATSEGMSESGHVQIILEIATPEIRPGRNVFGFLSLLDEGSIEIEASFQSGDPSVLDRAEGVYAVGRRLPLGNDIHALVFSSGRTVCWQRPDRDDAFSVASAGFASIIATPIQLGTQTHFLVFGLPETPEDDPFAEGDVAFVEVVGSSIAHRYYQRAQLDRLRYQQEHDALTGSLNRKAFRVAGRARTAENSLLGTLLLDIDGFAAINQRSGQMVGDDLLVEVAASLDRVDPRDVVARLGGDEFGVLLDREGGAGIDGFARRVQSYANVFHGEFHAGDRDGKTFIKALASIGAAPLEAGQTSFDQVVERANVAMHASKSAGGDCLTIFRPELELAIAERLHERAELLAAIAGNEFVLEYQPIVKLATRSVECAEALIRWNHPLRGRLLPGEFLPSAAREDLLEELTAWVMRRIAGDLRGVDLPPTFRCYFNVPSSVLESQSFMLHLGQLLFANPSLAKNLGIELTETEAMREIDRAIDVLKQLRRLGLLVSIDDFGTGYSSLSYVKRLPIDLLKLDKSFIAGIPSDVKDVGLAQLFFGMANRFALVSVGEGIESEEQAAWLSANGCMLGQGYLFARPMEWPALLLRINQSVAPAPVAARAPPAGLLFDLASGEVLRDGRILRISGGTRALLALLATEAGPVGREAILDRLWPELDGDAAANALKTCAHRTRVQLGDRGALVVKNGAYALGHGVRSTLARILELGSLSRTVALTPALRTELQETYERIKRGNVAAWATWPWFLPYRQKISDAARRIGERLVDDAIAQSDFEQALLLARGLIEIDPLSEEPRALVLRAYLGMGNRSGAARELATFRELLEREAGAVPSAGLQHLLDAV